MMPEAPALLSMMKRCPISVDSGSSRRRPLMSAALPGGIGHHEGDRPGRPDFLRRRGDGE